MFYKIYSYGYVDMSSFNYNDQFILMPVNILTGVYIIIVHGMVIYNIRVTSNRVADALAAETQQRRRAKDIRYAYQLIIVSVVFVCVWIFFHSFTSAASPTIAPLGYFSITIVVEIINASANSVVFILFNEEVKGHLKDMFCCCRRVNEQDGLGTSSGQSGSGASDQKAILRQQSLKDGDM